MNKKMIIMHSLLVTLLLVFSSCGGDDANDRELESSGKGVIAQKEGFFGWDTISLRNPFVRLDVSPELGGKIIGYEAIGQQILWHNTEYEGEIEIYQQYDLGENFINAGGAKVWPAPQDKWYGPPDRILDGLPYSYDFDGENITVTSEKDIGENRTGLQFIHSYSLEPSSSLVNLELSMTNAVNRDIEWALWHLATVPANNSSTIYVPVDGENWEVMYGEQNPTQWLGTENGFFRARYDGLIGKVGMKLREGWAAWHDERNDVLFVMMFPLDENAQHPHDGHNFEIWSSGVVNDSTGSISPDLSYMELEILGQLEELAPGESASMDVRWGVCRCSGVKQVLPIGVVSEDLRISEDLTVTGKFGVFKGGKIEEFFVDKDGNKKGRTHIGDATPISETTLSRQPIIPLDTDTIRYQLVDYNNNLIGIIGEIKL